MTKQNDSFIRASQAYKRHCETQGAIYQQPNRLSSEVGRTKVVLENIHGILATYDIPPSGRLRRALVTPTRQRRIQPAAPPRSVDSGTKRLRLLNLTKKEVAP